MTSSIEIQNFIIELIVNETKIDRSSIDIDASFQELGLDSINSMFLLEEIENKFQLTLSPLYFWDYPTIRAFSGLISEKLL
ncbi:MAG: acyl carrier protein [Fulvivirga sp.]